MNQKKVFQIVINGITENINAVKALREELRGLSNEAKALSKIDTGTMVRSDGNKRTTSSTSVGDSSVAEALKLKAKNEQDYLKNLQMETDEYKQQYQIQQEILRQRKENQQIQKDIASGARDENGNYTNTIAGLRAQLKEQTSILNNMELTNEQFAEQQRMVNELNSQLKELESAHGDFRRNVGNYPSGTKELVEMFRETQNTISDTNVKISELKKSMEGMGDTDLKKANAELDELERKLSDATAEAERLNGELSRKIAVDVGGNVQYFDNLRQASRSLQNDLQKLYMENKAGTKEFEDTIEALGRVRTAMQNVSGETKSYIGGMKGLEDTITMAQGFTSLVTIGAGLKSVFGGTNKEVDKMLADMIKFSVVLQGVSTLSKQIKDDTDIFGVNLRNVLDGINKFNPANFLKLFNVKKIPDLSINSLVNSLTKAEERMKSFSTEYGKILGNISHYNKSAAGSTEFLDKAIDRFESYRRSLQSLLSSKGVDNSAIDDITKQFNSLIDIMRSGDDSIVDWRKEFNTLNESILDAYSDFDDFMEITFADSGQTIRLPELEGGDELAKTLNGLFLKFNEIEGYNRHLQEVLANKEAFTKANSNFISLTKTINACSFGLLGMEKSAKLAASAFSLIAKGVKIAAVALKEFAAMTVVLLAVQLIMEGITWATEKLKNTAVDSSKVINHELERTNELLKKQIELNERLAGQKKISMYQKEMKDLEAYRKALTETGAKLAEMLSYTRGKTPTIDLQSVTSWGSASGAKVENIEQFKTAYQLLATAIELGNDKTKAAETYLGKLGNAMDEETQRTRKFVEAWKGAEWWQTAGDAQDDFAKASRAVINTLAQELYKIDWSKTEEAAKKFTKTMDDELYSMAFANIDNIGLDENWAKTFKSIVDSYRQMVDDMNALTDTMNVHSVEAQQKYEDNMASAITNSYERARKQREIQKQRELDEAAGNSALIHSIQMKYNTMEIEAERQHAFQIQQETLNAQSNRIAAMKDGLSKRLAELDNNYRKELASARMNENAVGDTISSITAKYNAERANIIRQFNRETEEFERQRIRTLEDMEYEYLREITDSERQIADMIADTERLMAERNQYDLIQGMDYDEGSLESVRNYFDGLLEIQSEYSEKVQEIERQNAETEYGQQVSDVNTERDRRIKEIRDTVADMKAQYDEYYEQGKIDEERYKEDIRRIDEDADRQIQKLQDDNASMLETMAQNHQENLLRIEREGENERSSLRTAQMQNYISKLGDMYSRAEYLTERASRNNVDRNTGIIDYSAERENLKNYISDIDTYMDSAVAAKVNLATMFSQNKITFEDFKSGEESIDSFLGTLTDAGEEANERLGELFQATLVSIANAANEYISQLGSVYDMFSELKNLQLDAMQEEIDREAEMLDRETDLLKDSYEKQADIVKEYTDRINDIESQLESARGDRRQMLIDQLASERAAQLDALMEQERVARQQEVLERKKEENEKKADKLEKKRKEQDRKDSMIQAVVSTAQAIANALSVKPAWAGIALAATVGALGAAQVATIAAQKYADGGIIEGKSHAQGGVKVMGGYAEVEGGEYIVNKRTTRQNAPLLEYVNSQKHALTLDDMKHFFSSGKVRHNTVHNRMFAEGGTLPDLQQPNIGNDVYITDDRPIVVSVQEITRVSDHIRSVKAVAGL